MNIPSFLDPLAPFKGYIIAAVLALALAGLAYAGKQVYDRGHANGANAQARADSEAIDGKNRALATAAGQLHDAALALGAARSALKAVAKQAESEVAKAREAEQNAARGRAVAEAAAERLRGDVRLAQTRVGRARGKSAACAALLDFDVVAERARLECDK
jgi:hypothetical protein